MTEDQQSKSTVARGSLDQTWAWVVLVAVMIGRLITSTTLFMSGIFYIVLLEKFHEDHLKTSVIGALHSGLMCFFGPIASILVDETSCRFSMVLGAVLVSLSYVCGTFINSLDGLILVLGFINGTANCTISVPLCVSLRYYFVRRRDIVAAISEAVVGLAMFFAAPLALLLLESYGLTGTFLIIAGMNAQICICGCVAKPSLTELKIKKRKTAEFCRSKRNEIQFRERIVSRVVDSFCSLHLRYVNLLKRWTYVLFLGSVVACNFSLSVCFLHLPNYVLTTDLGTEKISFVMEIFAVGITVGRIIPSLFLEKSQGSPILCNSLMLGIAAFTTITFPFWHEWKESVYFYAALAGFFIGGPIALVTAISVRLVGIENVSNAYGLELSSYGIGILAGPPLAGLFFERSGNYYYSFLLSGVVLLVGCIMSAVSLVLHHKNDRKTELLSSIDEAVTAMLPPSSAAQSTICTTTEATDA